MKRSRVIAVVGAAALIAGVLGGCVEQEPAQPTEQDWKVIKQYILKSPPTPKFAVNADLEGKVVYLGMDVDRERIVPGEQFELTHYWKVNKAVPGWKLFVHLVDPKNKHFVNADHKPIGGRYAVGLWKPGEIIKDVHTVTLDKGWDEPQVIVLTGLWRGQLRMKPKGPQDDANRIIAAKLPVTVAGKSPAAKGKRLVAVRAAKPVKVDGKLDDAVWAKAVATGAFVNTMTGGSSPIFTEAKAAWDNKFLYVAFQNKDSDVWTSLKKRDDKLWTQDAVEVFIDANGDGKDYIELQVNPAGAIFDSYLPAYRKNENAWNSKLKAGVHVDGTLNKREDKDRGWSVEMAIPLTDAKGRGTYALKVPPVPGDVWRVNFFRLDAPKDQPQLAVGWSPPLVGDFHKLDRFGELVFGDAEGKLPTKPTAAVPAGRTAIGNVVRRAPLDPRKVHVKKRRHQAKKTGGAPTASKP